MSPPCNTTRFTTFICVLTVVLNVKRGRGLDLHRVQRGGVGDVIDVVGDRGAWVDVHDVSGLGHAVQRPGCRIGPVAALDADDGRVGAEVGDVQVRRRDVGAKVRPRAGDGDGRGGGGLFAHAVGDGHGRRVRAGRGVGVAVGRGVRAAGLAVAEIPGVGEAGGLCRVGVAGAGREGDGRAGLAGVGSAQGHGGR